MGRIRTSMVKNTTKDLVRDHPEAFTTKFEDNKKAVSSLAQLPSKKMRNVIAGYATRLMKQQQ